MSLISGTRIGPYEITAQIGEGGMGEVYRATDTNLGRKVAIKVLPDAFTHDADRVARFEREAKTLAALNHRNIAAIYELERGRGTTALVMELVEGPTLADCIARSALPLDEALPIAKQIAEALEAAHEQGIVHRDLKPANIKVCGDGTVKVLDFGLAKAMEPAGMMSPSATQPPTITTPAMTQAGIILGTAAYMSPEQARGRLVDKRADIWAFGCVLFEMLAGRKTFDSDEVSDTLAFVITKEPDWSLLPAVTPEPIRKLLRRTLEKDRKRRLADIADARFEIDEAQMHVAGEFSGPGPHGTPEEIARGTAVPAGRAVDSKSSPWRGVLPWALTALLAVGLAWVLALWAPWRVPAPATAVRLRAELGVDGSLVTDIGPAAVLSPDGKTLAFVAQKNSVALSQLYTRRLDQLKATPMAGTDDARSPFFSPDGQWIAFFAAGKLKKVSVMGGAAVTLADAPSNRGGTWAEDGTIVFLPATGGSTNLMRVSSAVGTPEPAISADAGGSQRWPQTLPGGKALLYTLFSPVTGPSIVVRALPSGARKVLQSGASYGRYLKSGHLVYVQEAALFAAPFDPERLELTGPPVPVLEGVANSVAANGAQFAVSETGTLVYLPGQGSGAAYAAPISWLNAAGKTTPLRTTPSDWSNPRFSPDGRRLAIDILDGGNVDVAIYDWTRDTLTRLTVDTAPDSSPVWTPDGQRIVYRSLRVNPYNLFWQRANGAGDVQRLTESPNLQTPGSWHPSGKFLAFEESSPSANPVIMTLPVDGDETSGWKPGKPRAFPTGPGSASSPAFSPDGNWLAYVSNVSGRVEVYVRPFPGPGGQYVVSAGGGTFPTWSRARQELLYQTSPPDQRIMVVPYRVEGDAFVADKPRLWSDVRFQPRPRLRSFDLHPDGNRVAIAPVPETPAGEKQDKLVFVFNFFDELRRLAPVGKR